MRLVCQQIRTLLLLLFAAVGPVATLAAPGDWTRVSYPVVSQGLSAQPFNLTNTARAPPHTSANVMATGTALAQTGNLRVFDGAATTGAVYAFLRPSIAPNTGRGADNVTTYNPLRAELTAEEVAQGHAWTKHGYEFEDLGITQRYQFQNHVEDVINNPSDVRYYVDGRTVYIDSETRTVVVRNPGVGESTAFRPPEIDFDNYISTLPARAEPY